MTDVHASGSVLASASAKAEILDRIRRATADRPPGTPPAPIERSYRTAGIEPGDLEQFIDRLVDYRATVHRGKPAQIGRILRDRGVDVLAVPAGFPAQWLSRLPGINKVREPVDLPELVQVSGVLTTCAVAIAETGTIVLDSGPGQGTRALTLVPDYHLIVVRAEQVVPGVPDAIARLDPLRPQTWISGPSATSDIELQRVVGVHGPRSLDVLLVD